MLLCDCLCMSANDKKGAADLFVDLNSIDFMLNNCENHGDLSIALLREIAK